MPDLTDTLKLPNSAWMKASTCACELCTPPSLRPHKRAYSFLEEVAEKIGVEDPRSLFGTLLCFGIECLLPFVKEPKVVIRFTPEFVAEIEKRGGRVQFDEECLQDFVVFTRDFKAAQLAEAKAAIQDMPFVEEVVVQYVWL